MGDRLVGYWWSLDEEVDAEFHAFASRSCETAIDSVRWLTEILSQEMTASWNLTLAGIDDSQSVVRAADAWANISSAIVYAGRATYTLLEGGDIGAASRYAELVDDVIVDAIFAIAPFRITVHDVQAFEIDTWALEVWGDDVENVVNGLQRLSTQSSDSYCPDSRGEAQAGFDVDPWPGTVYEEQDRTHFLVPVTSDDVPRPVAHDVGGSVLQSGAIVRLVVVDGEPELWYSTAASATDNHWVLITQIGLDNGDGSFADEPECNDRESGERIALAWHIFPAATEFAEVIASRSWYVDPESGQFIESTQSTAGACTFDFWWNVSEFLP